MKRGVRFFAEELRRPSHYIVALFVGTALTSVSGLNAATVVAPFIVPFLVSSIGRTVARVSALERDLLLELPAKRNDPAFVMSDTGRITAAMGNTAELFRRLNVNRIQDLLVAPDESDVLDHICNADNIGKESELFAPALERWYRAITHCEPDERYMLVWLEDITEERKAAQRRTAVREFQIGVVSEIQNAEGAGNSLDSHERLARLILDAGYEAVLFARTDDASTVTGSAFRLNSDRELECSEAIRIHPDTRTPLFRSRRLGKAVAASAGTYDDMQSFERDFPVAPEVKSFLARPVFNLVNYHAGSTSIVAFNKHPEITGQDISFLEAAADAAHSLFIAVDVAREHDIRFLQAINGLCASAEFSDEITGKHVWRVNAYAEMLATELCTDGILCRNIGQVAAAHDIGKVAMPELVQAPRKLTDDEWKQMQLHTVYGAQIIDSMISLADKPDRRLALAREIALNHHQRWDGAGYPGLVTEAGEHISLDSREPGTYAALRPLKGEEIPVSARIVSICDTYDALRSARPYKPPLDHRAAVAIIEYDGRGNATGVDRFGEDVLGVFREQASRMNEIYEEMQDDMEFAFSKEGA